MHRSSALVCALCGSLVSSCTTTPTSTEQPARPTQITTQPAAQKPTHAPVPASTLQKETVLKTASGATFTAAAGWHLTRRGDLIILQEPDRELSISLAELEAPDATQAISAAWKRVKPGFSLNIRRTVSPPPREGWDAMTQITYDTPQSTLVLGIARSKGKRWYVALFEGKVAAFDRRGAQAMTLITSFKPPGIERESFKGKTARKLQGKLLQDYEAFIEQARIKTQVPGAAVVVVQDGKVVLEKGFGVRKLGRRQPVTPDTLFMIGSTTKSLTTLMMARLVDDKRFDWETPVTKLMPNFALGDEEATKKLSMQHTVCACTGLPRQDMEFLFEYAKVTAEERVASMKAMKPTTGFGETFQYSNTMVSTGGYVAARTYRPKLGMGPAYDVAMRDLVFRPLGMRSTTLSFKAVRKKKHGVPHARNLRLEYQPISLSDEMGVYPVRPAGGAWSTARDMARYLLLELGQGKQIVSKGNLLERRKPRVKITNEKHYGLGLFVEDDHGVQVVHHGGNNIGFTTDMFLLPEHGVGAVVLSNAGGANVFRNALRRKLLELLFDGRDEAAQNLEFSMATMKRVVAAELKRVDFAPDKKWLEAISGSYANPDLGRIDIKLRGDKATLDAGEWRGTVARKTEHDGTIKVALADPPLAGLALIVKDDKLVLEAGQHSYVFEPVKKKR